VNRAQESMETENAQQPGSSAAPVSSPLMDYDPNLTKCGRMAKQRVKLTFGTWHYRAEHIVEVGGNCTGYDVIGTAVNSLYWKLEEEAEKAEEEIEFVLTAANGDTLSCDDDEQRDTDWLKDMLIGAEIISIEPSED
jgi:hypothetical protein